jgi:hypothetical protein
MEVVELWDKMTWWAKFNKKFLKKKTQLAPWMKEGVQNVFLPNNKVRTSYGF